MKLRLFHLLLQHAQCTDHAAKASAVLNQHIFRAPSPEGLQFAFVFVSGACSREKKIASDTDKIFFHSLQGDKWQSVHFVNWLSIAIYCVHSVSPCTFVLSSSSCLLSICCHDVITQIIRRAVTISYPVFIFGPPDAATVDFYLFRWSSFCFRRCDSVDSSSLALILSSKTFLL